MKPEKDISQHGRNLHWFQPLSRHYSEEERKEERAESPDETLPLAVTLAKSVYSQSSFWDFNVSAKGHFLSPSVGI